MTKAKLELRNHICCKSCNFFKRSCSFWYYGKFHKSI